MHERERNRIRNEIRRLRLGESDMAQAGMGAITLCELRLHADAVRCLETGIVVCYARPYNRRNKVGTLGEEWAPTAARWRSLHDELCDLRDRLFAHTDDTEMRSIVDAGEVLGSPGHYAEAWQPFNHAALPDIIRLAESQQDRFRSAVEERQNRLAS